MQTRGSARFAGNSSLPTGGTASFTVGAPRHPTTLAGVAGSLSVALTWVDPAAPTDPFTVVTVYQATVLGGPYTVTAFTAVPGAQAVTVTGLVALTPYYFVVTATGPGGESGNSNEATATPTA